jgi:hypothetical protein
MSIRASPYTITVTGSYSASVTTSSSQLSTSYIDRAAFDKYYGVTTTFGENGTTTAKASTSGSSVSATTNNHAAQYGLVGTACIIMIGGLVIWNKKER